MVLNKNQGQIDDFFSKYGWVYALKNIDGNM